MSEIECERCGEPREWGVTLYDDHVGLDMRIDGTGITLCQRCRDLFEEWLQTDIDAKTTERDH